MIRYGTVGSNDLPRAAAFYDPLLETLGMRPFYETASGGRFYGHHHTGLFAVLPPHDGGPASVGNGSMTGFCLPTAEAVRAFHAKALALDAENAGDPGRRGGGEHAAYFAYFRDPDGNKICAYAFPISA